MATETESADGSVDEDTVRRWRPSRPPEHLIPHPKGDERFRIMERQRRSGLAALLKFWLAKPMVKLIIGMSLIIAGAIIFDATVNKGTWTQRQIGPQPVRH